MRKFGDSWGLVERCLPCGTVSHSNNLGSYIQSDMDNIQQQTIRECIHIVKAALNKKAAIKNLMEHLEIPLGISDRAAMEKMKKDHQKYFREERKRLMTEWKDWAKQYLKEVCGRYNLSLALTKTIATRSDRNPNYRYLSLYYRGRPLVRRESDYVGEKSYMLVGYKMWGDSLLDSQEEYSDLDALADATSNAYGLSKLVGLAKALKNWEGSLAPESTVNIALSKNDRGQHVAFFDVKGPQKRPTNILSRWFGS